MRNWALAICGVAAFLPGCSISIGGGTDTVDRSSEVSQARQALAALTDLPPTESIDCPADVEAKAGTTYECQATLANGQEVTLPARVASVDDNAKLVSNLDLVIQALAVDVMYRAADSAPKSVECPTDVQATVGKTFECKVTFKEGGTITATLKVDATTPRQHLRVVRAQKG